MTLTVDGVNVYFSDGSYQNNGRFRALDSNTFYGATSFSIGTYLLTDLQTTGMFNPTNPIPLDSWSNAYTGLNPAANNTLQVYRASNNTGNHLSGTWYSRGSSLFQVLIVRVA